MSKVIFITGSSSGIGAATAEALVAAGFRVAGFARRVDKLDELREKLGDEHFLPLAGSVTVQSDLDAAVSATNSRFGRLDGVFANAGKFAFEDLVTGNPDDWADMVDVNINGVLRTVRAALPYLVEQKSGHIVLTASIAGRATFPDSTVYAGTKHFLYGWAVGLRKQVQKHGISVGVISPGNVMNELWGVAPGSDQQREAIEAHNVLTSQDIANAVVYMLSQPPHVNVADMLVLARAQDVPNW